jgi:hypothetical protein
MERSFYGAMALVVLFALFFWYMVAHTMYDIQIEKQRSFASDECTLFFAGNWSECCVAHDRAYWQGGSADLRAVADAQLRQCVLEKTDNALLAYGMSWASRIGGTPYLALPWRWGYGWSFGRGYR